MNDRVVYQWGERLLRKTASAIVPMIGDIVYPLAQNDPFLDPTKPPFRVVGRSFHPFATGTTVFIEVIRVEDADE